MQQVRDDVLAIVRGGDAPAARPEATTRRRTEDVQLDPRLMEILACPACHSPLRADEEAQRAGLHLDDLRAGLPGARRHPGAARRRGPAAVTPPGAPDDAALDDPEALARLDPAEMLRAVATAGAQVRESLVLHRGRRCSRRSPRTTGRGRSWWPAWAARASRPTSPRRWPAAACPVPVLAHRGYRLPGWVGPMDLVVAVSCSGTHRGDARPLPTRRCAAAAGW